METSPSEIEIVQQVIDLYKKPEVVISAEQQLMTLFRIIEILNAREETLHKHALEGAKNHISGLKQSLRSVLDALVGPLIGKLVPDAIRAIEDEIALRRRRIALIPDDGETDWSVVYDNLQQLKTPLVDRDVFVEDEAERTSVCQAEEWHIGKLEYRKESLAALFERFVSKGERL